MGELRRAMERVMPKPTKPADEKPISSYNQVTLGYEMLPMGTEKFRQEDSIPCTQSHQFLNLKLESQSWKGPVLARGVSYPARRVSYSA